MTKKVVKKEPIIKKETVKKEIKYITLSLVRDDLGNQIEENKEITNLSKDRIKLLLSFNLIKEV